MILVNQSYKTSQSTGIQSEFKAILGGGELPLPSSPPFGKNPQRFRIQGTFGATAAAPLEPLGGATHSLKTGTKISHVGST